MCVYIYNGILLINFKDNLKIIEMEYITFTLIEEENKKENKSLKF